MPTLDEALRQPAGRSELLGCDYHDKGAGVGTVGRDLQAYGLVQLRRGRGAYADAGHAGREVTAGDVLVLFPGLVHSYWCVDGWSEAWVVFRGPVFAALELDRLLDRARPVLRPGRDAALDAAFDRIIAAKQAGEPRAAPRLVAEVHALIAEIVRLDAAGRDLDGVIDRACAMLGERLDVALDLEAVAAAVGIGYEQFRKLFARVVGVPPARYRQLRRIDAARRILVQDDAPLARVAERLGYCDQYFFNRQFTRETGMSPGRYRREFGRGSG